MCDASLAVSGGSYDGEYCDWENLRTIRLRKAHQCEVCCLWIPAGHYAAVRSYGSDGTAHSDYFHLACRSLWDRVSDGGRNEIYHQVWYGPRNLAHPWIIACVGTLSGPRWGIWRVGADGSRHEIRTTRSVRG